MKKMRPVDNCDDVEDDDSIISSSSSVDVCSNSPKSSRCIYSPGIARSSNDDERDDNCSISSRANSSSVSYPGVSNGLPMYYYPSVDYDSDSGGSYKYVNPINARAADLDYYRRYLFNGSTAIDNNNADRAVMFPYQGRNNIDKNNNNNNNAAPIPTSSPAVGTRKPKCAKCKNHGYELNVKDHKRYCKYQNCMCFKCLIVTKRQEVVALQIAVRRAQKLDMESGLTPVYDSTFLRFQKKRIVRSCQVPTTQPSNILSPLTLPSPSSATNTDGSVNATEHHRRLQALKQMLESFHSQGVDGTLICSYIILKECDFVVDKAFEKILDARNDIGSYTGRDPSNLVAPSSNNYWSTVVPQGAASPSTALLYPQLNCLPPYYGYPFPSSAAAAASGNAAATAAAAAAWQAAAGASGSGHPLMKAEPISLCSYPPVVQHPSSAGALNSVSSSLGGPGPPPPMMEIATSGDSRGSDCRGDESDREDRGAPGQERSVSVDRGMGSNDDVQSDRTPPGPGTEEAATSPTSALVLRSSFQPTSLSFAALHSYKNRTQSIES